jgi:hypothetical protein
LVAKSSQVKKILDPNRTTPPKPSPELSLRLARLERKIDTLTWIVGVQSVLLGVVTISYLLQLTRHLILFLLFLVPFLVIFRRHLPQWFRRLGQLWAAVDRRRIKFGESTSERGY